MDGWLCIYVCMYVCMYVCIMYRYKQYQKIIIIIITFLICHTDKETSRSPLNGCYYRVRAIAILDFDRSHHRLSDDRCVPEHILWGFIRWMHFYVFVYEFCLFFVGILFSFFFFLM